MSQERTHADSARAQDAKVVGEQLFPANSVPENMISFAKASMVPSAFVTPAKENGNYKGTVVAANEHFVVQAVGHESKIAVAHRRSDIEMQGRYLNERSGKELLVGTEMQIVYNGDKAKGYPYSRQKELDAAVGNDVLRRLGGKVEKDAEGKFAIQSDKLGGASLSPQYAKATALSELGKVAREVTGNPSAPARTKLSAEAQEAMWSAVAAEKERLQPRPEKQHQAPEKASGVEAKPKVMSAALQEQVENYAKENIKNAKQREAFLKHLGAATGRSTTTPEVEKPAKAPAAQAQAKSADRDIER